MEHQQPLVATTTSSSAPRPEQHSPLLRLPNELLETILEHAYAVKPEHKPVCRRLYPIQRRLFYREVRIPSYEALSLFCRSVRMKQVMHDLVVVFKLPILDARYPCRRPPIGVENSSLADTADGGSEFAWADKEDLSELATALEALDIIKRLDRLKVLDIRGLNAELFQALLYGPTSLDSLSKIESLLYHCDAFEYDQFNNAWWRRLTLFPSLRRLELLYFGPNPALAPAPTTYLPCDHLVALKMKASSSFTLPSGPDLVALAPNLVELRLAVWETNPSFVSILSAAPIGLKVIEISTCSSARAVFTPLPACLLDDVLPQFAHLESLVLCRASFTPSRLLAYLESINSSLSSLSFGAGSFVTDELLLGIVHGPFPHLRRLVLDQVSCACGDGDTTTDDEYSLDLDDDHWYRQMSGWAAPVFAPGATEEGLAAALEAAAAHGIVACGSACGAVGYEAAYIAEAVPHCLRWSDETGDYMEARELAGDDFVDAHIHELAEHEYDADVEDEGQDEEQDDEEALE